MRQMTFTSMGFQAYYKQTKREIFLNEMGAFVPWRELYGLIETHYPAEQRGRPPIGIAQMLRIYFLQQWFNLSDPQAQDCLYDSEAMCRVPDDCIDPRRLALFSGRAFFRDLITTLKAHQSGEFRP